MRVGPAHTCVSRRGGSRLFREYHRLGAGGREVAYGRERAWIVAGVRRIVRAALDEVVERRAAGAEIVETDPDGCHGGRHRSEDHTEYGGADNLHRCAANAAPISTPVAATRSSDKQAEWLHFLHTREHIRKFKGGRPPDAIRIFRMTTESSVMAITRIRPPQLG